MVIINFERQECSPSFSERRVFRIRKRRYQGIPASSFNRSLRYAYSSQQQINIKNLPDFKYSHIYNRTKNFLLTSYDRLKAIKRYISGSDEYCRHCRQQKQVNTQKETKLRANYLNKAYKVSSSEILQFSNRFSDSFVEKVQSQQYQQLRNRNIQEFKMPCCGCRCSEPSVEYYYTCDDPRRLLVSDGTKNCRQAPAIHCTVKRKKCRKWWHCGKRRCSSSCNQCCCCGPKPPKVKRVYLCPMSSHHQLVHPRHCKYSTDSRSTLHRLKYFINRHNYRQPSCNSAEIELYNTCVDNFDHEICRPHHPRLPPYNSCPKGYRINRRQRLSDSQSNYADSEDEYVDEPDSDTDDCCCCCPCRKNYNTTNVQTDEMDASLIPKTIDTQTDRCVGKKKCCRCCRNGCGICKNCPDCQYRTCHPYKQSTSKNTKRNRRSPEVTPNITPANSPRSRQCTKAKFKNKTKTIICKAASVQHHPSCHTCLRPDEYNCDNFINTGISPCHRMHNVMFNTVQPTPLLLDKMFKPINPLANVTKNYYNSNPLRVKLGSTPFLNACLPNDDCIDISESNISAKTKQRFMNAVCDSILCDLSSKRRNSFSDLVKSPDSGYQEPKRKRSFFSLKRNNSSQKSLKQAKFPIDHMIKTLKNDKGEPKHTEKNVIGEASKVVRGILEDISSKKDYRSSNASNGDDCDVLRTDSLRNILLNMTKRSNASNKKTDLEASRSDSILLDYELLPGMSNFAGETDATKVDNATNLSDCNESYTKLMKALDVVRNKTKHKMSKL